MSLGFEPEDVGRVERQLSSRATVYKSCKSSFVIKLGSCLENGDKKYVVP